MSDASIPVHDIRIAYRSRTETFRLWGVADLHIGNENTHEEAFKKTVEAIRSDPHGYWVYLGDGIEAIHPHDRMNRFEGASLASWIDSPVMLDTVTHQQLDRLTSLLAPIKKRCLGVLSGNHELEVQRSSGIGVAALLADRLKTKYLGDLDAWLNVVFVRGEDGEPNSQSHKYTFFLHHGWGGGVSEGAINNRLHQAAARTECDAFLVGHNHHQRAVSHTILAQRGKETVYRTRAAVMVGGYLPSPRYARRKGYPPVAVGSARLSLRPDTYGLEVILSGYGEA